MSGPGLYAASETISAIERAPAVAVLIGGYDGSGNYGDLVQLEAALELLAPLGPELLPLPVLERSLLRGHEEMQDCFAKPPVHPIFFDPGEGHEDGLLPVPAPARASFAVYYLYGGGYLNPSWGDRKLAMLRTADELIAATDVERVSRIASGLQVDPGWIATLAGEDEARLRAFELIGGRDTASVEALAILASDAVATDSGDDAVGPLRRLPPGHLSGEDGLVRINLHAAEHPWVTGRPNAMAGFQAEFAAELGRASGRGVLAQPLIAYLDQRIDERPMVECLAAACASHGVEVAEPIVLRPAGLETALTTVGRADFTLSCSYHVALTSLLLGVPAALLRDNAYYEQKATGLAEDFDLPPTCAISSAGDPAALARAIAATALDPSTGPILRRGLALAAARAGERRAAVEAKLLGCLGAGATAALRELGHRLRERSAEPAVLLAQLAASSEEGGAPSPLEPNKNVGQSEHTPHAPVDDGARELLDEVLASRSWRLTAPLRRTQALLSRRF